MGQAGSVTVAVEDVEHLADLGVERELAMWALQQEAGNVAAAVLLATSQEGLSRFKTEQAEGLPEFELQPKKQEDKASSSDGCVSDVLAEQGLYMSQSQLEQITSALLYTHWVNEARGLQAALPEYEPAVDCICVQPEMMSMSRLGLRLKYLEEQGLDNAPPIKVTVMALIKKAYFLRSDDAALHYCTEIPGLAKGNMFEGAIKFHESLRWEKAYLLQALPQLLASEDPEGLRVVMGLMRQGADHCLARKNFTFNTIIERIKLPSASPSEPISLWGASASIGSAKSPSSPDQLQTARRAVSEVTRQLVEETKDMAFKSTFLEPTKMHFRRLDEPCKEDQVDMHGANTYLAVLSATLGVQLNRRPHLDDKVLSVDDFLEADPEPAAWKAEYFGQDWENVRELREQLGKFRSERGVLEVVSFLGGVIFYDGCFIFTGNRAFELANAAVNPEEPMEKRQQLAKYLEKFASWFSEEFIVQRIISRLFSDEGRVEALQLLMADLLQQDPTLLGGDGEADVRFWLWDMSEIPARFRDERAVRLLQHAGVLRKRAERKKSREVLPALEFTAGAEVEKLGMVTSLPPTRSLEVKKVTPGGWAARQGVEPGDTFMELNGRAVSTFTPEEFKEALLNRPVKFRFASEMEDEKALHIQRVIRGSLVRLQGKQRASRVAEEVPRGNAFTAELIHRIFSQLDLDGDGRLVEGELLQFARHLEAPPNIEEWRQQYEDLCRDRGWDPAVGLSQQDFSSLVNDESAKPYYCGYDRLAALHSKVLLDSEQRSSHNSAETELPDASLKCDTATEQSESDEQLLAEGQTPE